MTWGTSGIGIGNAQPAAAAPASATGTSGSGGSGPPAGVDPYYWGNLPQVTKDSFGGQAPPTIAPQEARQIFNPNGNPNGGGFGYGMAPQGASPAPAAPAAPTPGLPATGTGGSGGLGSISGVGLGSPGVGEQYFQQTSPQYFQGTNSQGLYGAAMGQFGAGGTPTTNNQQGFFSQFESQMPNVSNTPGLDPYYDNAIQRGEADIDKSMAARGLYGSSAANDETQGLVQNLRGQQAQQEAQYNLQRLGELRNWQGLGGQLAQGADTQSLGQSANQRGWLGEMGNLAGQSDVQGLNRITAGQNAANAAQNMGLNRFNTAFGAAMGLGGAQAGIMGDAYNNMFTSDQGLFNNGVQMGLAGAGQNLNMNQYLAGQNSANNSGLLSAIGTAAGKSPIFNTTVPAEPSTPYYSNPNAGPALAQTWGYSS